MANRMKDFILGHADSDASKEEFLNFLKSSSISDSLKKAMSVTSDDLRRRGAARKGEDMSKRVTESSYKGLNVKPDMKKSDAKKPVKKITKKEVTVETPTGNIGSVDRTSDVIGPNMGLMGREAPVTDMSTQASPEDIARIMRGEERVDPHEQARRMMGFGSGMKKGGAVKAKKKSGYGMKSGGSVKSSGASKRGDGCAVRGKTKGRMV